MNDSLDVITSAMTIAVAAMRYDTALPRNHRIKIRGMEQKTPEGAENMQQQRSPNRMVPCNTRGCVGWTDRFGARLGAGAARALSSMEYPDSIDLRRAAQAAEQLYGRPDRQGKTPITDQRLLDKTARQREQSQAVHGRRARVHTKARPLDMG